MGIKLPQFIKCPCGKMHTTDHVTIDTRCSCGANLYELIWGK